MRSRSSRDASPCSTSQSRTMELGHSISAPGADALAEKRVAEHIRTIVIELLHAFYAVLQAHLQGFTTTPATASEYKSIPPDAITTTEGCKEVTSHMSTSYTTSPSLPRTGSSTSPTTAKLAMSVCSMERTPSDVEMSRLWTLTTVTARTLVEMKTQSAYDMYPHTGY
jgi:hypothetical protein